MQQQQAQSARKNHPHSTPVYSRIRRVRLMAFTGLLQPGRFHCSTNTLIVPHYTRSMFHQPHIVSSFFHVDRETREQMSSSKVACGNATQRSPPPHERAIFPSRCSDPRTPSRCLHAMCWTCDSETPFHRLPEAMEQRSSVVARVRLQQQTTQDQSNPATCHSDEAAGR